MQEELAFSPLRVEGSMDFWAMAKSDSESDEEEHETPSAPSDEPLNPGRTPDTVEPPYE